MIFTVRFTDPETMQHFQAKSSEQDGDYLFLYAETNQEDPSTIINLRNTQYVLIEKEKEENESV